ncbi:PREDICTED: uncharacterized protein LOC109355913 isoform X2 [Lupinus angustifolius]|uniref:uncharacterized protein LOC109355913 isoform X2 n=1 Tax=Lupinus angustifolius TaxID=3871 RepID=UPI00092F51D0|nr:PREDICTED: uncharacterized protein LOC109355913 isoform X2 [Lupinus angustifolius]
MEPDPTRRVLTRKRKPLSDCTNTFNSHSSPSLPIKPNPPPPSPILSTPSLNSSSSLHGTGDVEASGCISIKYSRRRKSNQRKDKGKVVVIPVSSSYSNRRKDKGKAIATPLSSTPNLRISNSWEKSGRFEGVNVHKAKALTVPLRKKHRSVSSGQDALKDPVLQDFIEEQRAYFKAIDEFKLSEEEVESGDELD